MNETKNNLKCNDCESKNLTINYLNDRITELSKPIQTTNYTTSYIREVSPVRYTTEVKEIRPSYTRVIR